MPRSEAQKRADRKYYNKTMKRFSFDLHIYNDADIIDKLDEQISKAGYVKDLIRADIKKGEK